MTVSGTHMGESGMTDRQSGLSEALGVVRRRIQQLRERKEILGEQNTKATLIEPVLTALGWNLQEIDEVRREYKRKPQDNPVDYALFLNRTGCLLIEAKSLEKDLSDRKWISQNLSYAAVLGVQWCVLTNGDEYRIYNSHETVDVEDKLFRSVQVSGADAKLLTDTLVLLSKDMMRGTLLDEMWKAHFIDRKVRAAIESLLLEDDGGLVRLIQKKAAGLTLPDVRASIKRAKIRIDFPVPSLDHSQERAAASRHGKSEKALETLEVMAEASLENLIGSGLIKPPLELERDYKGTHLTAVIAESGKVVFGEGAYDSLSTAAGMARRSVIGAPADRPYPQTNGWQFWQYRDEHGDLQQLDHLRKQYVALAEGASA